MFAKELYEYEDCDGDSGEDEVIECLRRSRVTVKLGLRLRLVVTAFFAITC